MLMETGLSKMNTEKNKFIMATTMTKAIGLIGKMMEDNKIIIKIMIKIKINNMIKTSNMIKIMIKIKTMIKMPNTIKLLSKIIKGIITNKANGLIRRDRIMIRVIKHKLLNKISKMLKFLKNIMIIKTAKTIQISRRYWKLMKKLFFRFLLVKRINGDSIKTEQC